jgi:hypothetical protein
MKKINYLALTLALLSCNEGKINNLNQKIKNDSLYFTNEIKRINNEKDSLQNIINEYSAIENKKDICLLQEKLLAINYYMNLCADINSNGTFDKIISAKEDAKNQFNKISILLDSKPKKDITELFNAYDDVIKMIGEGCFSGESSNVMEMQIRFTTWNAAMKHRVMLLNLCQ